MGHPLQTVSWDIFATSATATPGGQTQITMNEDLLWQPLQWSASRAIKVSPSTDLFDAGISDEWIDQAFAVMALAPQHAFQVLTSKPARMLAYFKDLVARQKVWDFAEDARPSGLSNVLEVREKLFPLANVELGVRVSNQVEAMEGVPLLLSTPAAVRWVAVLGKVDLTRIDVTQRYESTAWLDAFAGEVWLPGSCGISSRTLRAPARLNYMVTGQGERCCRD